MDTESFSSDSGPDDNESCVSIPTVDRKFADLGDVLARVGNARKNLPSTPAAGTAVDPESGKKSQGDHHRAVSGTHCIGAVQRVVAAIALGAKWTLYTLCAMEYPKKSQPVSAGRPHSGSQRGRPGLAARG